MIIKFNNAQNLLVKGFEPLSARWPSGKKFLPSDAIRGIQDFIFPSVKLTQITSDLPSLQSWTVGFDTSHRDVPANALHPNENFIFEFFEDRT